MTVQNEIKASDIGDPSVDRLQRLGDDEVLAEYEYLLERAETYRDRSGRLEHELYRRMEALGAETPSIPSEVYICELVPGRPSYSPDILVALKEAMPDADLNTCYTPAWTEEVDHRESFNMAKVHPIARRIKAVADIVEKAKLPGRAKLKFERRD